MPVFPLASVTVIVLVPLLLSEAVKTPLEESILPNVSSLVVQVRGVVAPLAEKEVVLPFVIVEFVGVTEIAVVVVCDVTVFVLSPEMSSTAASQTGQPTEKTPTKPRAK